MVVPVGKYVCGVHNKMKRDNFTESDLAEIAEALNCDLKIQFISKETGEVL